MAGEWDTSDRGGLLVLAVLVDDFWTAPGPDARRALAAEIRLQRQAYGLAPIGRRRLAWKIDRGDQAERSTRARRATDTPGPCPPSTRAPGWRRADGRPARPPARRYKGYHDGYPLFARRRSRAATSVFPHRCALHQLTRQIGLIVGASEEVVRGRFACTKRHFPGGSRFEAADTLTSIGSR